MPFLFKEDKRVLLLFVDYKMPVFLSPPGTCSLIHTLLYWLTILGTSPLHRCRMSIRSWALSHTGISQRLLASHIWYLLWRVRWVGHWLARELTILNTWVIENKDIHLSIYACEFVPTSLQKQEEERIHPHDTLTDINLINKKLTTLGKKKKSIHLPSAKTLSTLHSLPSRWMLLVTDSQHLYALSSLDCLFPFLFFFFKGIVSGIHCQFTLCLDQQNATGYKGIPEITARNAVFSYNLKKGAICYVCALSPKYLNFL